MINFQLLEKACECFSPLETPFLTEMIQTMKDKKPFVGIKVLHNVHLTLSTIFKIIPLLHSGADLTVTVTENLKTNPQIKKILMDAGVNYIEPKYLKNDFDIVLDCCASLIDSITPRLGAVELTQTGSIKYQNLRSDYPVISIDESNLKRLETFFGTGDGFLRGFIELTKEKIRNKKFIIFGYGKVGQGVAKSLSAFTTNLIIVEKDVKKIRLAQDQGNTSYSIDQRDEIKHSLDSAFCAVTATGEQGVISRYFKREDFSLCKYLVNIGSADEFGDNFLISDVLFSKRPINFSLIEPTRIKFLDPIFYAHNFCINLILSGKMKLGFNLLPREIDDEILVKWGKYYNQNISDLYNAPDEKMVVSESFTSVNPMQHNEKERFFNFGRNKTSNGDLCPGIL